MLKEMNLKYSHRTGTFSGQRDAAIFFQTRIPTSGRLRGIIVLLHGLGEHSDRYFHIYERLLTEGYGFYALDHRGFGRSDGKRGHVDQFEDYLKDAGNLIRMAREAYPGLPLILYGHSMGGLISLAYAMKYGSDIDYLAIASPPIGTPDPPGGKATLSMVTILSRFFPRFTLDSKGDPRKITRDQVEVDRKKIDPLCHTRITLKWIAEFFKAQGQVAKAPLRLRVPSLLMLQGTGDIVVSPESAQSFFKGVKVKDKMFRSYPGYYHELHNDLEREIPLNDIADWLNRRIP